LNKELLQEYFEYKDGNFYWKKQKATRIKIGELPR